MRAAVVLLLALGCAPTRGACVSPYPGAEAGPFTACRQDLDRTGCAAESPSSAFTLGRSCPQVGFPCGHDAWGAVLFDAVMPSGVCPPRTTRVR